MRKLVNLLCLLALIGLPIACGGADFEIPPISPVPPQNPPAQDPSDPPQGNPDFPEIHAVETPEICAVNDPDCGNHDHPEVGPVEDPEYGKVSDHPPLEVVPNPGQVNPCLVDPEAEGCE